MRRRKQSLSFEAAFGVSKVDEDNTIIESLDGLFKVKVGKYGTLDIIEYRRQGVQVCQGHRYDQVLRLPPTAPGGMMRTTTGTEEKTTFEEPLRRVKFGILEGQDRLGSLLWLTMHRTSSPECARRWVASIYATGEIRGEQSCAFCWVC